MHSFPAIMTPVFPDIKNCNANSVHRDHEGAQQYTRSKTGHLGYPRHGRLRRVSLVKGRQTTKALEACPPRKSRHGPSHDPLESSTLRPLRRSFTRGASLGCGRACPSRGVVPQWHACITTAWGTRQRRVQNQSTRKTENRKEHKRNATRRNKQQRDIWKAKNKKNTEFSMGNKTKKTCPRGRH